MKVRVDKCTELGNGRFMIVYRLPPGASTYSAISLSEIPVGRDVIVRDGKVVS